MVATTLMYSMISSIVKCFVAVIGKNATSSYYVATIGNLIMTLFPVFFITNSPRVLNLSKEELRITMLKYRHQRKYRHLKEKLGDIIELLQESPEFDVMGYFTLGRARIVDILGFITTYMVILLQFQVTETSNEACLAGNSSAFSH
ncbi:uncharacterized protein LOC125042959 [Penaeus chinensis]|uniref:uncharacterized protein LOC125042959 n=1 Tax=Penaeus chinensis TaxID=139456 RepID=UPI001FB856D9|nr:uncharacterized protein LOC125042959 [Penaeus chinensis]